jgi:hypothetical protein
MKLLPLAMTLQSFLVYHCYCPQEKASTTLARTMYFFSCAVHIDEGIDKQATLSRAIPMKLNRNISNSEMMIFFPHRVLSVAQGWTLPVLPETLIFANLAS